MKNSNDSDKHFIYDQCSWLRTSVHKSHIEFDFDVQNFNLEMSLWHSFWLFSSQAGRLLHSDEVRSETSLVWLRWANDSQWARVLPRAEKCVCMHARCWPWSKNFATLLADERKNTIFWVCGELGRSHCWTFLGPTTPAVTEKAWGQQKFMDNWLEEFKCCNLQGWKLFFFFFKAWKMHWPNLLQCSL